MHPVDYLFEDIYRNHWGIEGDAARQRGRAAPVSASRFQIPVLRRRSRPGT